MKIFKVILGVHIVHSPNHPPSHHFLGEKNHPQPPRGKGPTSSAVEPVVRFGLLEAVNLLFHILGASVNRRQVENQSTKTSSELQKEPGPWDFALLTRILTVVKMVDETKLFFFQTRKKKEHVLTCKSNINTWLMPGVILFSLFLFVEKSGEAQRFRSCCMSVAADSSMAERFTSEELKRRWIRVNLTLNLVTWY